MLNPTRSHVSFIAQPFHQRTSHPTQREESEQGRLKHPYQKNIPIQPAEESYARAPFSTTSEKKGEAQVAPSLMRPLDLQTDNPKRGVDHQRTESGFTLVELMVVSVASAIVIAGAFALHQGFVRQHDRAQKVTEVQQTLRVARQYLEKQLRNAGNGMKGDKMTIFMRDHTGTCREREIYGLMFHNSNSLNAITTPDVTPTDTDSDPDWFEMASVNTGGTPVRITGLPGASDGTSQNINVSSHEGLVDKCGSMFTIPLPQGGFCLYFIKQLTGGPKININAQGCSGATVCAPSDTAASKKLIDCTCNPTVNPGFAAAQATGKNCETYVLGMQVTGVGPGIGGLRLFPADETQSLFGVPFAVLAHGQFNVDTSGINWNMVTDLIEDLQFEVILKDGRIFGTAANSQDVPLGDTGLMRAVRYSIRAVSRTPAAGKPIPQTIPPYADQCPDSCTFTDGRVRRLVQGVVQLRNFGL